MTLSELQQQENLTYNAMRMRWKRCNLNGFNSTRQITEDELAIYRKWHGNTRQDAAPATRPSAATAVNKTNPVPKGVSISKTKLQFGIYDTLMWADMLVGLFSLYNLLGPVGGGLLGLKICLFFEQSRRIVRRKPVTVAYGTENAAEQEEHNAVLDRTKWFNMIIVFTLSCIYCWANGFTFFRAVVQYAPELALNNTADYIARVFACAVMAIALASMYSLKLQSNSNYGPKR